MYICIYIDKALDLIDRWCERKQTSQFCPPKFDANPGSSKIKGCFVYG